MSAPLRVLYVEDDPKDLERYSRLLSESSKIEIIPKPAPEHVDELSLSPKPDLIFIDYRLTQRQPSGISAKYLGGTLATYIAEQMPEVPIAIFSTRSIMNSAPKYEVDIPTIDCVLYKEDVNKDPANWRDFILEFIHDFKSLSRTKLSSRTWNSLMKLLEASSLAEEEELQRASPPRGRNGQDWNAHDITRWVLQVLFIYPGIFYDSLYASASLGIQETDFLQMEVQSLFQNAQYKGVFSAIKKLWWRNRLHSIAFKCVRDAGLEPILSDNFATAFEKNTGKKLTPSICIFSNEPHADTICYILKKPVKMKYTLGYLPDDRPESMETARVSFKAILEENIDTKLLPLADAERLTAIRRAYKG